MKTNKEKIVYANRLVSKVILCTIVVQILLIIGVISTSFIMHRNYMKNITKITKSLSEIVLERDDAVSNLNNMAVKYNKLLNENIADKEDVKLIENKVKDLKKENKILKEKKVVLSKKKDMSISKYGYAYDNKVRTRKYYMQQDHLKYMISNINKGRNNIDPHVMLAVYDLESAYNYKAKTKGGSGYGQLIYSTGKWWYEDVMKAGVYKREYALNPTLNIKITSDYFMYLVNLHKGDLYKAMKSYSGNAIGSRYMDLVSYRLKAYTGKDLGYYNKISITEWRKNER